jgi:thiamine biosynthesis protein ThiI
MKTIIVRYGELALKSRPVRRRFEQKLIDNIKLSLEGLEYKLKRDWGRVFIETKSVSAIAKRLLKIPGIVSISPSIKVDATIDSICSAAVKIAEKDLFRGMSFAVRTSRVGKHTFSSKDVSEKVGSAILAQIEGTRVNLSTPDQEILIEIRGKDAYLFTEIRDGIGGLPVGTQGKIVTLFSGGLNSVATTYLMMRRGCIVFPLFPVPHPDPDHRLYRSTIRAMRKLSRFYPKLELRVLPLDMLLEALGGVESDLAYYVYKRAVLRVAEIVAEQTGADAIASDEDLEQIAQRRLANLGMVDGACKLPVLKPLDGMNEDDIVRVAHNVGPLGRFLKPFADQIPSPARPIPPRIEEILEIERRIKVDALVRTALSKLELIKVGENVWT